MDQTWTEWQHMIEGPDEGPAIQGASSSHIQFTLPASQPNIPLIPHLESVHHMFLHALKIDARSLVWSSAWFPEDDRLCPLSLDPWLEFPQLQEATWKKIRKAPELVNSWVFPSRTSMHYTAHHLQWYTVHSEATLKQFAHRTLDDFLAMIIDFMGRQDTLRYNFSVRGRLKFDHPSDCCVSVTKLGFQEPAYAVLYIPSFCLTVPELVAGLRATSPMGAFNKEPDTFEEHATYGDPRDREALVFLHITPEDSSAVEHYLCVPGRDVVSHGYDSHSDWVRFTALGQVLAFALQSLSASPPSQEWQDAVYQSYRPLKNDHSVNMPKTPGEVRFRPPAEFIYENSVWPGFWRKLVGDIIVRVFDESPTSESSGRLSDVYKPYCTQTCLRGTFEKDMLDENCPNVAEHGTERHQISTEEICERMNEQLRENRYTGFQQLHIIGRTYYLLKATLLSHGYTMLIKATDAIAGIPNSFYMRYMLLLSWSGIRTDQDAILQVCQYLEQETQSLELTLQEHGAVQKDASFRNVLWNPTSQSFVMIDLEDLKWLNGTPEGS
ncbi:unnamed protein product [Penicillium nalgiovense]|nr:unnamed protein product [Penicillium nalgiovense]